MSMVNTDPANLAIIEAADRKDLEATRAAIKARHASWGCDTSYLDSASQADIYAISERLAQEVRENKAAAARVEFNISRFGEISQDITCDLYPAKKGRTWIESARMGDQFGLERGLFIGCVQHGRDRRYSAGWCGDAGKFNLTGFKTKHAALAALLSYWRTK